MADVAARRRCCGSTRRSSAIRRPGRCDSVRTGSGRELEFTSRPDVGHAYYPLAEAHRLLHRGQIDRAEAFACQSLKTLEQATLDPGDWQLAWAFSGLPELRAASRIRRGAARPVEVAAGMAYLKEFRTMQECWAPAPKKGPKGGGGGAAAAE